MDLDDHRRAIWRRRWRVVLLSLLVAAAVYARSRTLDEVFIADARLQVEPGGSGVDVQGDQAQFLATTYAALLSSNAVVADAVTRSGLALRPSEADDHLSAKASSTPGFLTVAATAPTPKSAQELAQGGADALAASVTSSAEARLADQLAPIDAQLEQLLAALRATSPASVERDVLQAQYQSALARRTDLASQGSDRLRVVDAAAASSTPISPTPLRDALLALVIALILNAELAVALEALSGRFSGRDDEVVRVTGLPVLTRIPNAEHSDPVEALRVLRTSLLFLESSGAVRCLAVVGVDEGVGTTFVATGLAAATAGLEVPVVLIDGDLRSPTAGSTFGVPDRPGLGDLGDGDDPGELLQPAAEHPHLRVLPAGTPSDDPAGLVSGRFRDVLDRLASADLIVVDTPPAGAFAEAAAIAAQCDLCVVVIDRGTTRRKNAVELIESLRRVGANPAGIVLNREAVSGAASRSRASRR
jgi:Mrp family chromosome partitioning ATPase/capsular polysaccharide biosynthesis protein